MEMLKARLLTSSDIMCWMEKKCEWCFDLYDVIGERRPVDNNKSGGGCGTWRIFSLRELHAATNSFNYDNKIGEGGFGSVYWGQLPNGDQVWSHVMAC